MAEAGVGFSRSRVEEPGMAQAHAALYGALAEVDPLEAAYVMAPRRETPQNGAKVAQDLRRRLKSAGVDGPKVVALPSKVDVRTPDRPMARPAAEDRLARLRRRFAEAAETARDAARATPTAALTAPNLNAPAAIALPIAAEPETAVASPSLPTEARAADSNLSSAALFEDALFVIEDASVSLETAFAPIDLSTTIALEGAAPRAPFQGPVSAGLTLAAPVELIGLTTAPVARFTPFAALGRSPAPEASAADAIPAEPKARARAFRVIRFRLADLPARAALEAARLKSPVAASAEAPRIAAAPARSSAKGLVAAALGGLSIVVLVVGAQALLRL